MSSLLLDLHLLCAKVQTFCAQSEGPQVSPPTTRKCGRALASPTLEEEGGGDLASPARVSLVEESVERVESLRCRVELRLGL